MSTASLLVEIKSMVKDRLANSALDEEPLDLETQGRIAEAMKGLGRYFTHQEIREMLESS